MDKILAFIKEAKWFSISIGIFMVIWLGPKLLDKIEELQAEAERQARIEQQEIARQEQIKKDAIEREERLARLEIQKEERKKREAIEKVEREKRLAIEKVEREKRLAIEKVEREKREAAKKVKKELEKERQRREAKRLAELEIGLVCRNSRIENYEGVRGDRSLYVELILLRDISKNIVGVLSVYEKEFSGTKETIKSFNRKTVSVSPVNYKFKASAKRVFSNGSFVSSEGSMSIDRTSLDFFYDGYSYDYYGTCFRKNAELIRKSLEGHNLKNKTNNQL